MAEFLTIELLTFNCRQMRYCTRHIYAGMAELADALDLGSSGRPCRFKSCHPQEMRNDLDRIFEMKIRSGSFF